MPLVLLPQVSGNGYYPYGRPEHQWGTQQTVDAIQDIARSWYQNQRYEIGVGHLSLQGGGDTPHHGQHEHGRHVDLRPIRTDRQRKPVTYQDPAYDRDETRLLVDVLRAHANVRRILFNDPELEGVEEAGGHDDHLHVEMRA